MDLFRKSALQELLLLIALHERRVERKGRLRALLLIGAVLVCSCRLITSCFGQTSGEVILIQIGGDGRSEADPGLQPRINQGSFGWLTWGVASCQRLRASEECLAAAWPSQFVSLSIIWPCRPVACWLAVMDC